MSETVEFCPMVEMLGMQRLLAGTGTLVRHELAVPGGWSWHVSVYDTGASLAAVVHSQGRVYGVRLAGRLYVSGTLSNSSRLAYLQRVLANV